MAWRQARCKQALQCITACLLFIQSINVVADSQEDTTIQPLLWSYDTVAEYPHDPHAFTQGLTFDRVCSDSSQQCFDVFWESTGLNGRSSVRQVDANTGKVLMRQNLSSEHFAEGLARVDDTLFQLTWQTSKVLRYRTSDLQPVKLVGTGMSSGLNDGWGLAFDGEHLLATESSAQVHWLDPKTLAVVKSLTVKDREQPIKWLNEGPFHTQAFRFLSHTLADAMCPYTTQSWKKANTLEVIDGELWANIWQRECIARIDLSTGRVVGWVLLHGLREAMLRRRRREGQVDVLNGIAWDKATGRIFVTGKLWPSIFEIQLKPVEPSGYQKALDSIPSLCWPPA